VENEDKIQKEWCWNSSTYGLSQIKEKINKHGFIVCHNCKKRIKITTHLGTQYYKRIPRHQYSILKKIKAIFVKLEQYQ